jgi:hypothetical protein
LEDRRAAAAFGLAAGLFLLPFVTVVPGPSEGAFDCPDPSEVESVDGATSVVACGRPAGAPLRGPARLLFGLRLDPNTARARSLEALPGIGPARAAAIASARCDRPFASVADLERVDGIGPKTRAAIAPWLEVASPRVARCEVQ